MAHLFCQNTIKTNFNIINYYIYSRVPNNRPLRIINFWIFFHPLNPSTPLLLIFKKISNPPIIRYSIVTKASMRYNLPDVPHLYNYVSMFPNHS